MARSKKRKVKRPVSPMLKPGAWRRRICGRTLKSLEGFAEGSEVNSDDWPSDISEHGYTERTSETEDVYLEQETGDKVTKRIVQESRKMTATCSACGSVVLRYNLKRHIQSHAELSPGQRAKVIRESSWKIRKRRTRLCTAKHCSAQIRNLRRHLQVTHQLTSEARLKEHLLLSRSKRKKSKCDAQVEQRSHEVKLSQSSSCAEISTRSQEQVTPLQSDFRDSTDQKDDESCENLLTKFEEHLQTIAGSWFKASKAETFARQVWTVLQELGATHPSELLCQGSIAKWVKKAKGSKRQPSTIANYLRTLGHFHKFIRLYVRSKWSKGTDFECLAMSISSMQTALQRMSTAGRPEKHEQIKQTILKIDDWEELVSGAVAQKCKKLLKTSEEGILALSHEDLNMVRNYLITQVSLHTFQRAHIIAKIQAGNKLVSKDEEEFVEVTVKKHKTSSTYGAAIVF